MVCTAICPIVYPPTTVGNPPIDTKPITDKLLDGPRRAGQMEITQAIALTCVASRVAALMGNVGDLCSGRRMPVFYTGGDVMAASLHDLAAILTEFQPAILTVMHWGPPGLPRGWYSRAAYGKPCVPPRGNLIHCDEYRYYATGQAGPGASLWKIPKQPNIDQGNRHGLFYGVAAKGCRLSNGTPYAVIPITVPSSDNLDM